MLLFLLLAQPIEIDRVFDVKERLVAANPELIGKAGKLAIEHRNRKDARASEGWIWITPRMIRLTNDDSELAFIIGHEIAHVEDWSRSEREADIRAMDLMHAAGFDMEAPERLLYRMGLNCRLVACRRHNRITVKYPIWRTPDAS